MLAERQAGGIDPNADQQLFAYETIPAGRGPCAMSFAREELLGAGAEAVFESVAELCRRLDETKLA